MYIDTHVQLNFSDFDSDRAMVIGNAKKAGVKQFIVPGVDHLSCRTAVHLATQHPGVIFAAVGFHPYEAPHNPDISYLETLLRDEQNKSKIVAVGECGLDYHQYKGEIAAGRKDVQQQLFETQLRLHSPMIFLSLSIAVTHSRICLPLSVAYPKFPAASCTVFPEDCRIFGLCRNWDSIPASMEM